MLYLMTNHINIIIIILLTIKIISSKATQSMANKRSIDNAELYGNFTAIEFLKELEHFQPTYDNILIMQNQNATISRIFYTHLIKLLHERHNNARTSINSQQRFGALDETVSTTFVKSIMDSLQVPVLQLNELQSFYLKRHYSEHFLSIVYIDINIEGIQMTLNDHKGLLEKLSSNLLHMTTSKVFFLLNFPIVFEANGVTSSAAIQAKIDEDVMQDILVKLFHHCWQQKIINVVALLADYKITRKFYSYTHFPEFEMEVKTIALNSAEQDEIYPNRLKDLKGYKLPIIIGGAPPRMVPYTTLKGKRRIGGFVGHFIETFCKAFNCTLVQPLPFRPHHPIPSIDLVRAVRNGTVEISAGILDPGLQLIGFTYPIQALHWCIMLPVEPNIPGYKLFALVFKGETFALVIIFILIISMVLTAAFYIHGYHIKPVDIICRDDCLRGILGQSFNQIRNPPKIIRYIYLLNCVLGILLTTSYTSYFSTYTTRPPKEPAVESYDDMLKLGLKAVVWEPEYRSMEVAKNFEKYTSIFYLISNYGEFLQLRDSFNTKYAYVIPSSKWLIIREQQKIFTTPLFRFSNKFCLVNNKPMSFPVQENSIYSALIHQLIEESSQSGFLYYWLLMAFFELVAGKQLKFEDLSATEEFVAMTVADLRHVMIFLSGIFALAIIVFMCELLVFYRKRIIRKLYKVLCGIK